MFLRERGCSEASAEIVWDAIALHSTSGIPLRKGPEAALLHLGAGFDVFGIGFSEISAERIEALLAEAPRLNFTLEFRSLLLDYVQRKPMAQLLTWTHDLGRHACGPACPSIDDLFAAAPFAE